VASVLDADTPPDVDRIIKAGIPDPVGTFYRFSLPAACCGARRGGDSMNRITIDPVTRLEGHGKIEIFLDPEGEVQNAYFQVPELRGFERFCVGRLAEDMPNLTDRICGVCPEAHHMAATKALDALFHVEAPPAARKLRELFYSIFFATDHTTHFYALSGPDFVMGPDAPKAERNILGVIKKVGMDVAARVLKMRRDGHDLIAMIGGRRVQPNWGLPGGVSRGSPRRSASRCSSAARRRSSSPGSR